MEIPMKVTKNVKAKELRIYCKVSDRFTATVFDEDGNELGGNEDDGYVPEFMPGEHYGDYIILNIDLDTGMVTNWKKPTPDQIVEFIGQQEQDD